MATKLNPFDEATSSGRPIIENLDSMTCSSSRETGGANGAFAKKVLPGILAMSLANLQGSSLSTNTFPSSSGDRSSLQVIISRQPTELCSKLNKAVSRFEVSLAEYGARVVEYGLHSQTVTLIVAVEGKEYTIERSIQTIGFSVKKGDVLRLEAVKRSDGSQFFRYYRDNIVPLSKETEKILDKLLDV
ncbi:MAG: hypothetical protein U9N58_03365 [Thermodesulfobacteriota bacterium]|nr:hypothetical protein [Thermodesulfobacteriota bacterium]